jgi:hypothetical protein
MVNFSDEDKAEMQSNYFAEGIHKVKIGAFEFATTDKGQEYAEFTVYDPAQDERQASVRFWFTKPGGRKYAFNILRGIFVHNAPEDKKDATREKFNSITNTQELEKACNMLAGKECWLQVYADGTYESQGKLKTNYARDIFGYEPSPKPSQAEKDGSTVDRMTVTDENGNEQTVADFDI